MTTNRVLYEGECSKVSDLALQLFFSANLTPPECTKKACGLVMGSDFEMNHAQEVAITKWVCKEAGFDWEPRKLIVSDTSPGVSLESEGAVIELTDLVVVVSTRGVTIEREDGRGYEIDFNEVFT